MGTSLETTVTLTLSELEALLDARDAKFLQRLDDVIAELKPQKSETVDTSEVAKIFGKCPRTIRNWQMSGQMPPLVSKSGQDYLWNRAAVMRMVIAKAKGGRPRKAA